MLRRLGLARNSFGNYTLYFNIQPFVLESLKRVSRGAYRTLKFLKPLGSLLFSTWIGVIVQGADYSSDLIY